MSKVLRPKDIPFTVNLKEQSLNQLEFLRAVNAVPSLKDEQFLKFALYRYERLWLPLAYDHRQRCLSAPLDIEWIWHCHMLSPRKYSRDCHTIAGELINHTIRGPNDYKSELQKTEKLWRVKYPTLPFHVDLQVPSYPKELETFQSSLTYDVVSSALRQNVFFYQVSLPHYCDTKYLDLCLLRYKQFIYLKQQLPDEFIVPWYDIDIMWHSHQLNPKDYEKDMIKYIGNLFNHDDRVNDGIDGSNLNSSHVSTKTFWRKYFQENFSQCGAMYRGQPPEGILYQMSDNEMFVLSTRKTILTLHNFVVCLDKSLYDGQVCLNIEGCVNENVIYQYATLKGCSKSVVVLKGPIVTEIRTNQVNKLTMTLTRKKGLSGTSMLGKCSIDMCEIVEEGTDGGSIDIHSNLETQDSLHISGSFTKPERDEILLFLEQGKFETAIMPETVCQMWGPMTLSKLPADLQNTCDVATHRFKNHVRQTSLSVRIIHSPKLSQAVIQVYHFDKMTVIAHLIHDHLPLRTQVKSQDIPSIEPQKGERALLIKNKNGDWGIVTGRWREAKEGIFNAVFHSDARIATGVLSISFYKLATGKMSKFDIGSHTYGHRFELGPLIADLQTGNIVLDGTTNEVPEYITLAFSVALLTVLCVPRVAMWTDGSSLYADRMNLVVACGFNFIHSSQRNTGQWSGVFPSQNNAADIGGRQDHCSFCSFDDNVNAIGLGNSNTTFDGVFEPHQDDTAEACGTNDYR